MIGARWTDAQKAELMRTLDQDRLVALAAVNAVGPERTLSAIYEARSRARHGRWNARESDLGRHARRVASDGWPIMRGEDGGRDREFVQRVVQAAVQEGLLRAPESTVCSTHGACE